MSKQNLDKSILDIINDPDFGTPEDKLRLFVIFYLCSNMSDVSFEKLNFDSAFSVILLSSSGYFLI